MRYKTQTEDQVQEASNKFAPWPDGIYDFEIFTSEAWTSLAGNESIKLKINVYNSDGDKRVVFTYLSDGMPHILKHAAEACGQGDRYARNEELEPDDFAGKTGRLMLGTKPAKDGYPAQNTVRDFIVETTGTSSRATAPRQGVKEPVGGGDLNDEIPFGVPWQ